MPVETGYTQQTTPQAAAPLPLPTAASEGAAIGAGISDLGRTVDQTELQAYRLQRQQQADQQAADFDHKFSVLRQNMDTAVQSARDDSDPGAPGHTQAVMASLNAQKDDLFSGITLTKVQQHAQGQWDSYSTQLGSTESTWENGQRIGKLVNDVGLATDASANRARDAVDPNAFKQEIEQRYSAIDALQGVPGNIKDKLRTEAGQTVSVGYLQGVTQRNPEAAKTMLDQGAFNDVLTPEQVEALGKGADVQIRRQDELVKQQAAVGKADFHEQVATVKAQAANGIDVSAQLPQLMTAAAGYKDTSTVEDLKGLLADSQFSKIFAQTTPLQREQQIATLSAKPNPTDAEQMELHWLKDKGAKLDSQFDADPAGFMVQNGHAAPPIGAQREQWASSMATATGRPAASFMLTQEEARQMGALKQSGETGSDQVLQQLDQFSPGPARAGAARAVAPNDALFQHLAQVDPTMRPTVRAGLEAIKGNPQIFGTKLTAPTGLATMTQQEGQLRDALRYFSPTDVQTTLNVSRGYMAGVMTRDGITPDRIDQPFVAVSIRRALGGGAVNGQQLGGLGDWNGHPVVLPNTSTNGSFTAGVRNYLAGAKPVNPDGTPVDIKSIYPVVVAPNQYRFVGADGRFVAGKDKKPLTASINGAFGR